MLCAELFLAPNPYVEALTPNVTVFENRACKEELRLNEVIWVGPNPLSLVSL